MEPAEGPDEDGSASDGPWFDEAFIRGASIREPSADERERRARIDAAHRQVMEDARRTQAGQRRALVKENRKATRRSRRRKVTVVVVLLVVVGTAYWSTRTTSTPATTRQAVADNRGDVARAPAGAAVEGSTVSSTGGFAHPTSTAPPSTLVGGQPPAGVDEQPAPLGHPAAPPATTGPYVFIATQTGSPAPMAYDPCRPIHVVINDRREPPGGDALVRAALARASQVSGLQFVIDGPSNEVPAWPRPLYQPDRYPGRWAPALIAWTDPTEVPHLAGDVAGTSGSRGLIVNGVSVYVSGMVMLDGPQLGLELTRPGGAGVVQSIIQHEVGHLLGLNHVTDPTQLMYPVSNGVRDYQAGDQLGLEALGGGACVPDI